MRTEADAIRRVEAGAAQVAYYVSRGGELMAVTRRPGTVVDLRTLEPGQRVGYGDGEAFHLLFQPAKGADPLALYGAPLDVDEAAA